jgi:hypothetical protein
VLLLLSHTCGVEFQIPNSKQNHTAFISNIRCAKKLDEGRENNAADTLRGTLLLRMATLDTLRKRVASSYVEGSLPSSLAKDTSIVKKQKERALSLPGKLPAPSILANFALRFGSGSPLPLINA